MQKTVLRPEQGIVFHSEEKSAEWIILRQECLPPCFVTQKADRKGLPNQKKRKNHKNAFFCVDFPDFSPMMRPG